MVGIRRTNSCGGVVFILIVDKSAIIINSVYRNRQSCLAFDPASLDLFQRGCAAEKSFVDKNTLFKRHVPFSFFIETQNQILLTLGQSLILYERRKRVSIAVIFVHLLLLFRLKTRLLLFFFFVFFDSSSY